MESEKISGWYDAPWQWEAIKNNQQGIGLLYSTNDQYIPLSEFAYIKKQLKPNYVFKSNKDGHFTQLQVFPEVLDCLRQMRRSI